ncbi:alpha/beta fold hydrolase [Salinirussus salinus]|uniref:alpha/beta fold hydrolase n=1 Tax=Salinirussus salinus TaxID=1198300 RepID=UPI001358B263|nr:alpha/beta hydrolase [Salinirussus salinus]
MTTGVDEATYVGGPADGHPIAFVHGAGLSWRMWLPQLRTLEDEYRLFAPDLPGHGRRADESFSFDVAVRVLDDLLGDEADEPALLVGQSLGGYVAVEYAARRPARVAGLVLSGASADYQGVLGVTTWVAGLLNWIRSAIGPLDRRFREGVKTDLEDGPLPPDIVGAVVDGGISLAGYGQGAMAMAGVDFPTKLRTFDDPVLLLNGAEDRLNPDAAETLAPTLSAAETDVIPDAGHTCSIERPDEYTAIVREFAAERVWAGAGEVTDGFGSEA